MLIALLFMTLLVIVLGTLVYLLMRRLLQFQEAFDAIHDFSVEIYSFTSKFEGRPLLTDAPEAVHLNRLMTRVREFFKQFEEKEEDRG